MSSHFAVRMRGSARSSSLWDEQRSESEDDQMQQMEVRAYQD